MILPSKVHFLEGYFARHSNLPLFLNFLLKLLKAAILNKNNSLNKIRVLYVTKRSNFSSEN